MSVPQYLDDRGIPRAPTEAEWAALTPEERLAVVEALPPTFTEAEMQPPEGDPHRIPADRVSDALDLFYRRQGRGLYIGRDLMVYYPGEQRFAPDLFVVFDMPPGDRNTWVVSHEGRGLDFALEVLFSGDRKKDLVRNVERYARLGIPEYFVLDIARRRIRGWRLEGPEARSYTPIVPQGGRTASRVLGLDLALEGGRCRLFAGTGALEFSSEIIERMNREVGELHDKYDELERALDAAERGREDAERAREDAERAREAEAQAREAEAQAREAEARAREASERRVAELEAELARLRAERGD